MRMRKSIDEAMKWYQQKKQLKIERDPTLKDQVHSYAAQKKNAKIISIQVLKCFNLSRQDQTYSSKDMQPFYFYQFYTYEYTSPVVQGSNVQFDVTKQYEVEVNEQFMDYMKAAVLKIDFMDESVEYREHQRDYIGSVRVPLQQLVREGFVADNFPVVDEMGKENGRAEVRIESKDYDIDMYGPASDLRGGEMSVNISRMMEKDLLKKIAFKLAEIPYEEIDMFFDLFLQSSSGSDQNKVLKKDFKDIVLLKFRVSGIVERDLELLLKAHPQISGKDYIDRNDFKHMFESYIR
mmetsp:Transcript_35322/g.34350  ORF Transcript_35322/g.34350 Transcript_35322/m.34350 type:complete len:293 (-) Transcript_35322:159-1037(-)